MYLSVCTYSCKKWNALFITHREGIHFRKSSPFWCFFDLLIHHIRLHTEKAPHLQHPFLFPPGAPVLRIHPFPFVCQTNACKSNFDLTINWEEFIRGFTGRRIEGHFWSKGVAMAHLRAARKVSVCWVILRWVLNWRRNLLRGFRSSISFLQWQLLKNAV